MLTSPFLPFFPFPGRSLWGRHLGEGNSRRFPARILHQIPPVPGEGRHQIKAGRLTAAPGWRSHPHTEVLVPPSCPWETTEEPFTSPTAKPSPGQSHPHCHGVMAAPGDGNKWINLTFCVRGARRRGSTAAHTGVFAFIRSIAPGRRGQTLPTAEDSQGHGTHGFPRALSAPGLRVPSTPSVPGAPGYPAVPAAAVPEQQAGLGVSTATASRHAARQPASPPLHPQTARARQGPRRLHAPKHGRGGPAGLGGGLSPVSGREPPSAAKLNTRCFLHVENKPGQSRSRYFQAGRAEMLPARRAPTGREKGRRWREGKQKPPSPREPEQWKPQAALAPASPPAEAGDGGKVVVAQGHRSARAAAGAASHHPATAILLLPAGRRTRGEHSCSCQG